MLIKFSVGCVLYYYYQFSCLAENMREEEQHHNTRIRYEKKYLVSSMLLRFCDTSGRAVVCF